MTVASPVTQPDVYIGGEWSSSAGGDLVEVHSPANQQLVGRARLASRQDVDRAVEVARRSFNEGTWRDTPPAERGRVLRRAADILSEEQPQLARTMTSELGCPLWFAERQHVPSPLRNLRYYAGVGEGFEYDEIRSDGTNRSLVTHEPAGVVAAVTPWNAPLGTPVLKVAPALAAGCSVVLKPPPETPLTVARLGTALREAGLPDGVLSILPADREVGEHLVRHPEVDKVAFTGSTAAGKRIMSACSERIARLTLELGGKSAAIALEDADFQRFVDALIPNAMMLSGQACIAHTRVLVPRQRESEMRELLTRTLRELPVGDPFDPETVIGPLVSSRQRDRVESYIELARREGASIATGGARPAGLENGWFVEPTLLADVDNTMRVAREEIFGPVLALIPYDGEEEAVRIANDSPYGLSGSVWSAEHDRAVQVARRIRTGMVSINGAPQAKGTPFGGFKQSGLGREMSKEGFQEYLEPKSIAIGSDEHA